MGSETGGRARGGGASGTRVGAQRGGGHAARGLSSGIRNPWPQLPTSQGLARDRGTTGTALGLAVMGTEVGRLQFEEVAEPRPQDRCLDSRTHRLPEVLQGLGFSLKTRVHRETLTQRSEAFVCLPRRALALGCHACPASVSHTWLQPGCWTLQGFSPKPNRMLGWRSPTPGANVGLLAAPGLRLRGRDPQPCSGSVAPPPSLPKCLPLS